jgi:hypothetical protein
VARDPAGVESNNLVQRVTGRVSVTGLDRAQGGRLIAAARSFAAGTRTSPRQGDLSPAALGGLAEMLDATDGLLTRLDADETFSGLSFQLANGNAGTLGKIQMHVESSAEDKQLNAGTDIALDELSLTSVSTDTAAFLPHHVTARSVLAGMPIGPLKAWLRAAVAPGADPALLQKQAATILAIPGTKAAIESVAFDAGPLHVRGAVHFVPRANGEIGADIHISATGMDALLAQVQKRPSVQGMLPMLFLAKGMGRGQGDSIVWDIGLGGGPVTINGTPFGQPAGNTR